MRPYYARYLINTWNEKATGANKLITTLSVYYMREMTMPYGVNPGIEKMLLQKTSASDNVMTGAGVPASANR